MQLKRYKEAGEAFKRVLALTPHDVETMRELARLCGLAGDPETAMACLQQALRIQPDYAPIWLTLADVLKNHGDIPGALACFRKAIALQTASSDAGCPEAYAALLFTFYNVDPTHLRPDAEAFGRALSTGVLPSVSGSARPRPRKWPCAWGLSLPISATTPWPCSCARFCRNWRPMGLRCMPFPTGRNRMKTKQPPACALTLPTGTTFTALQTPKWPNAFMTLAYMCVWTCPATPAAIGWACSRGDPPRFRRYGAANAPGDCVDDPRLPELPLLLESGKPQNPPLTLIAETYLTLDTELAGQLAGQLILCPNIRVMKNGKPAQKVMVDFDDLWDYVTTLAIQGDTAKLDALRASFIARPLPPEEVIRLAANPGLEE